MEKQKLLWIILSITIAAIIVILGGLVLLRDETLTVQTDERSGMNVPMSRLNAESYAIDYTRENYPLKGLEPATQQDDITSKDVVIGEAEEGEKSEESSAKSETAKELKKPERKDKNHDKAASYAPEKTTAPSKAKTVTVTEYWIQAGSYKERSKAELLNNTLMEKGLPGRILTKDVKGETFYRVRIGPYLNKKEAEKFLVWVKALNGLDNSYISSVAAKRKQ